MGFLSKLLGGGGAVLDLTRIPQLAVPEHRDDDEQIPQHVHHGGEDQDAGEDADDPGGAGAALRAL